MKHVKHVMETTARRQNSAETCTLARAYRQSMAEGDGLRQPTALGSNGAAAESFGPA
ncbi:hypothetical protein [Paenibacillus sp. HGF7]|uniref:hypothetical protein n=1 Tax=Paenibacillus sp. HGF7 TaxID=944559 RepID=UPI00020D7421|nr:hypothetical protein [Paenibacillus sp. HGF7]EGL16908.1 hypothetical protein HMPREF9413_0654 [Paenibacillus sp. HGF7]